MQSSAGSFKYVWRRELAESGCVRHALQSHFTILKHLFGLGVFGLLDYGKNCDQDYFD